MSETSPTPASEPACRDPSSGGGRRERQRRRRRAELYDIAIGLFVEKSYEGTTMEDIAERADVARATVFNHFPRKAVFLEEWARRRRALALEAAYRGQPGEMSLRDVLMRYFTELGRVSQESREASVALLTGSVHATDIWRRSPLAAELAEIVRKATADSATEQHPRADHVGLLLSGAYFVIILTWVNEDPAPFDITEELTTMVDTLLYGVVPRGGAEADSTA